MMRLAELCAGYGGLGMGLAHADIKTELAWYAETDPAASAVMSHHHPGVPNLGDLTRIEEPPAADIVTAGFPCQPVSAAGQRAGVEDERWLIRDVVAVWRASGARWLVLENVLGLLSANDGEAFGQVIDALAEVGAAAEWACLRASDVGAPHRRERWFCVARNAESGRRDGATIERPGSDRRSEVAARGPGGATENTDIEPRDQRRLPAPRQADLLPTPTASQPGGTPEQHLERKRGGKMNRKNPTITDLGMVVQGLPNATIRQGPELAEQRFGEPLDSLFSVPYDEALAGRLGWSDTVSTWGKYSTGVIRWAYMLGRQPPQPTVSGRLNPQAVEWMMGLPAGHVTDCGLKRADQLKILGNGVVPQQAAAAIPQLMEAIR